jgi:hypothetical protein
MNYDARCNVICHFLVFGGIIFIKGSNSNGKKGVEIRCVLCTKCLASPYRRCNMTNTTDEKRDLEEG